MLAFIGLALIGRKPKVSLVLQDGIERASLKWRSTSLLSRLGRAAFRDISIFPNLSLKKANILKLRIAFKDMPDRLSFCLIDSELLIYGIITKGGEPTRPKTSLRDIAILSRMRSPVTSRSNWANDNKTLSVSLPMEFVVLKACVTETNETS